MDKSQEKGQHVVYLAVAAPVDDDEVQDITPPTLSKQKGPVQKLKVPPKPSPAKVAVPPAKPVTAKPPAKVAAPKKSADKDSSTGTSGLEPSVGMTHRDACTYLLLVSPIVL